MSLGHDAPCSGVGYRFLRFAGSETFFRSLVFCFFSLCCCLCFSSPSFFAFFVLDILGDSLMQGDGVGVFKSFCAGLDWGVGSRFLNRHFSNVFVTGRCLISVPGIDPENEGQGGVHQASGPPRRAGSSPEMWSSSAWSGWGTSRMSTCGPS